MFLALDIDNDCISILLNCIRIRMPKLFSAFYTTSICKQQLGSRNMMKVTSCQSCHLNMLCWASHLNHKTRYWDMITVIGQLLAQS